MGDSQKSLKICASFLDVNYSFHQSSQERQKWLQRVTRETENLICTCVSLLH